MTLKIKCKCGMKLAIPEANAGKKLACPGCKKLFRIPIEKFQASASAAGVVPGVRPAKEARMPQAVAAAGVANSADPAELDLQPVSLDADLLGAFASDASAEQTTAPPPSVVIVDDSVPMEYAAGERSPSFERRRSDKDVVQESKRGFWADAFMAFTYPFANVGNGVNLGFILFFAAVSEVLDFGGLLGSAGQFFIFGWLAAVYLSIVQDTCAGSPDMPGIKMQDGPIEDIVKPAFLYIGSFAVSFFPAVVMLIAAASGPSIFIWGAIVAAGLGIFLWPMMLILFALHSLNSLARLDLVFLTIARTFAAYLAIWLLLLLVAVLMYLPAALWLLSLLNVQTITQPVFLQGRDIVIKIGLALFQTYLMLVAMRIIGLYYLHFKRRFAIVME